VSVYVNRESAVSSHQHHVKWAENSGERSNASGRWSRGVNGYYLLKLSNWETAIRPVEVDTGRKRSSDFSKRRYICRNLVSLLDVMGVNDYLTSL